MVYYTPYENAACRMENAGSGRKTEAPLSQGGKALPTEAGALCKKEENHEETSEKYAGHSFGGCAHCGGCAVRRVRAHGGNSAGHVWRDVGYALLSALTHASGWR